MHAFILEKGDAGNNEMHLKARAEKGVIPVAVHAGYRTLSTEEIGQYLVVMPVMRELLGLDWVESTSSSSLPTGTNKEQEQEQELLKRLEIIEVGDGNLNLVYLVHGPKGTVVVKQALPYVRCVGESWPVKNKFTCTDRQTLRQIETQTDKTDGHVVDRPMLT